MRNSRKSREIALQRPLLCPTEESLLALSAGSLLLLLALLFASL